MRAVRRVPFGNAPVSNELNVSAEVGASVGKSAARRYRVSSKIVSLRHAMHEAIKSRVEPR